MCGVAGYVGKEKAGEILLKIIEKTEKLEERPGGGAGIATIHESELCIRKDMGFVKEVEERVGLSGLKGNIGIAHNRSYPKIGEPSQVNAHPHLDCKGEIAVIHAGEIDNFIEIQKELEKEGHKLISRIDTAVIPHVIEGYYKGDLKEAVRRAIGTFTGEYAFLALSRKEPDRIVGVMMGRSLAVGEGKEFCIFSSSIDSVAEPIDEWRELNREIATITKEGYLVKA